MMIRCPGCGGRNPRDTLSCEWCRRPFVPTTRRGLSARWWGALSGAIIATLLVLVGGLALLNATRPAGRTAAAAPTAAPTLLPLPITSPLPAAASSPTVAPPPPSPTRPPPSPTPTPAPRYARVTNTGGLGANLRREPAATAPPVAAVAENGMVRLLGPEARASDGRLWRQVEDSRGNQGWVPADFLVEAPGPGG